MVVGCEGKCAPFSAHSFYAEKFFVFDLSPSVCLRSLSPSFSGYHSSWILEAYLFAAIFRCSERPHLASIKTIIKSVSACMRIVDAMAGAIEKKRKCAHEQIRILNCYYAYYIIVIKCLHEHSCSMPTTRANIPKILQLTMCLVLNWVGTRAMRTHHAHTPRTPTRRTPNIFIIFIFISTFCFLRDFTALSLSAPGPNSRYARKCVSCQWLPNRILHLHTECGPSSSIRWTDVTNVGVGAE